MKFFNIMPFMPSNVKKMAAEYRRYSEATGMKILLCSMTLNPEGDDPYLKPKSFIRAFSELKEELKDTDIELGILLQSFIGHGWSSSSPSVHLFQPTINHTGTTKGSESFSYILPTYSELSGTDSSSILNLDLHPCT